MILMFGKNLGESIRLLNGVLELTGLMVLGVREESGIKNILCPTLTHGRFLWQWLSDLR